MHIHPNARLRQRGPLWLVIQHLEEGRSLSELVDENGISLRCAYCWLARYHSGSVATLANRRRVLRTQRRTLVPQQLQHSVALRHQRLHMRHIAGLVHTPFSTVARTLSRLGLGPTHTERTARPSGSSRTSIKNGTMAWPSRTRKSGNAGCLATWGSITG